MDDYDRGDRDQIMEVDREKVMTDGVMATTKGSSQESSRVRDWTRDKMGMVIESKSTLDRELSHDYRRS